MKDETKANPKKPTKRRTAAKKRGTKAIARAKAQVEPKNDGTKPILSSSLAARNSKLAPSSGTKPIRDAEAERVALHILSDSTGNLAQHMLMAFLTQFPREAFALHHHHFIQTEQKLERTMASVAKLRGIVFHAVVHQHMKQMIERRCLELAIPFCDLTGRFVEFLTAASGIKPQPDIGRLHHVHASSYHQRIRALEFTLEHDDGLGLDTLHEADAVLVGVSRTSKTPTSIYLAQQGFRVANVSLAMNVPPPRQLLALKENVVGLTINTPQLVEIRRNRSRSWRLGDTNYNDPRQVNQEILWCRRLFEAQGWPTINVTDQAIEETAVKTMDLLGLKVAAS